MSEIEEQLNSKFEEIRANRNNNLTTGEEDAENNRRGPYNSENNLFCSAIL